MKGNEQVALVGIGARKLHEMRRDVWEIERLSERVAEAGHRTVDHPTTSDWHDVCPWPLHFLSKQFRVTNHVARRFSYKPPQVWVCILTPADVPIRVHNVLALAYQNDLFIALLEPSQVVRLTHLDTPEPPPREWPAVVVPRKQACRFKRSITCHSGHFERRLPTVLKCQHRVDSTLSTTDIPSFRGDRPDRIDHN
jgi:hypothetical protein